MEKTFLPQKNLQGTWKFVNGYEPAYFGVRISDSWRFEYNINPSDPVEGKVEMFTADGSLYNSGIFYQYEFQNPGPYDYDISIHLKDGTAASYKILIISESLLSLQSVAPYRYPGNFVLQAQIEFVGNARYGRLTNFLYDKTIQNTVYSTTLVDGHIMVSHDNGINWSILFVIPYPATINDMRLTNNGKALSFMAADKIMILDLQSLTIVKEFNIPAIEPITWLEKYTVYDNGLTNTAVIITGNKKGPLDIPYNQAFYTIDDGNTWNKIYDSLDNEKFN